MAYDENLVQKIRAQLANIMGFTERKMFGGVGFMIHGNMACEALKEFFIARLSAENYDQAIKEPHVRTFDITGRSMKGRIMVPAGEIRGDVELKEWIQQGVTLARSLPRK